MDRLHSMRVFARVIEQGSFAGAARGLRLSPAVVTRLVADLEEHLNARLINRTTRRLALTDVGELYLERVRQILAEIDEAESLANPATAEPRGHLRVLCSPAFAAHQIAKRVPAFLALYPKVTVELSVPGPVDAIDEAFDISILTEGRRPLDAGVNAQCLARCEMIACASPEYLNRRGRPQHPRDVAEHDVMLPGAMQAMSFYNLNFNGHTVERRGNAEAAAASSYVLAPSKPAFSTTHTSTMYAGALAGLGITALPSFVAEDALRARGLERVLPQWHLGTTTIHAGLPTRAHVPARTRVFLDFLLKDLGGEARDPWLLAAGCETLPPGPLDSKQTALEFQR